MPQKSFGARSFENGGYKAAPIYQFLKGVRLDLLAFIFKREADF